MQRYTPGVLPKQGAGAQAHGNEEQRPLAGAERLCELIRSEHGRAGVGRFLGALAPFVPRDFLEQLARRTGADCPPPQGGAPPDKPHERPREGMSLKPEQLLKLMNMGGGSGGIDPSTLLKLMGEMSK